MGDKFISYSGGSPLDRLRRGLEGMVIKRLMAGESIGDSVIASMFVLGLTVSVENPEYGRAWGAYLEALRGKPGDTLAKGLMKDITIAELEAATVAVRTT